MSLTTQEDQAQAEGNAGWDRARQAATQATGLAKNASANAAQGVQDAREWAAPRIAQGLYQAREWAAPRIDQAGHTVEETVAPKVAEMLAATAQLVDPSPEPSPPPAPPAKRSPRIGLIAALVVAAAAGGTIVIILRGRRARMDDIVMVDEEVTQEAAEPEAPESDEPAMTDAGVAGNGSRAGH